MMRSWRLRRRAATDQRELQKDNAAVRRRVHYATRDLTTVTIVSDEDDGTVDRGLIWSDETTGGRGNDGNVVVLTRITGTAKLHPHLCTGMRIVRINNVPIHDAVQAREMCEDVPAGEPLTLLLWKPSSTATSTQPPPKYSATRAPLYVTAAVYKETADSKTGVSLQTRVASDRTKGTSSRVVRVARVTAPAPPLRAGLRLVAIDNYARFSHHTEAVALIRSLPAGYVTLLLADDHEGEPSSSSSQQDDGTASLTTATAEDDSSMWLDTTRRGGESPLGESPSRSPSPLSSERSLEAAPQDDKGSTEVVAPPPSPKVITVTLTPDQAQQVALFEDEDEDRVYVHRSEAATALQAGMRVLSLDREEMASAGHYEHVLQTTDEDVTLRVCWDHCQAQTTTSAGGGTAHALITATANKPCPEAKTGVVLSGNASSSSAVTIARITRDSIFANTALTSGMRILSVNGHDWFTNYQEAIGLIRSLQGEITVVATTQPPPDAATEVAV